MSLVIEKDYLQRALKQYPTLAAYPYIAEAITYLGSDNHTATCYYPAAEFYLTKHADKFTASTLNEACKVAHANDHLEMLAFGDYTEVQQMLKTYEVYKPIDHFLDTVFGETADSDPAAP